jgi:hypothetical protein
MSPLKITLFAAVAICHLLTLQAQVVQKIAVKLVDDAGVPVKGAQVSAILKSGAYQDALWDKVSGHYKCEPTEQCIKVFAAAVGHEATVARFPKDGGLFPMVLKKSPTKNSAVIHSSGELPGIDGWINPILDSQRRTYIYARKIGLESRGRPAMQPLYFAINKPIEAVSPTGRSFKIWVIDITQEVSVVDYTLPK